jgi:hypothetical protein
MANTATPPTDYLTTVNKEVPIMRVPTQNSTFILVITAIISLFLIIVGLFPSNVKSNSLLVVGLFICFILKTIYDTIKWINIVTTENKENNDYIKYFMNNVLKYNYDNKFTKYIEYIIPICAILYLVMIGIVSHMFHIILPNMDSPCLSRIINLKIFAFIFTIFIVVDALILYLNKPRYYIISIALYTLMGMGFMLHYKRSVINLHNKLDDNCIEETEVKI